MSILQVIKDPDPKLREKSKPVAGTGIDEEFKKFMHSLLETMYHEGGIGIASIQVGKPLRALIVDIPLPDAEGKPMLDAVNRKPVFIINPEIKWLSDEKVVLDEGCLSVRGEDGQSLISGKVERSKSVEFTYTDLDGALHSKHVDGGQSGYNLWFARCFLHEYDHLDGILFIDKLFNADSASIGHQEL